MDYLISKMKPEDVPKVLRLEEASFTCPWSFQDFLNLCTDKNYVALVCRAEEKLLGYAVLLVTGTEADVANVCTAVESRGKGVATCLLNRLFDFGDADGVETYFLEVRESNLPARKLYEKLSFTEIGIRKDYYRKPREHAVIMRKITTTHFTEPAV